MTGRPDGWIELCVASHARLVASIAGLTGPDARRASRLPGWTVGHVLTHLARNADGHRDMFEAARRGEIAAQYPGGREQRAADIDAGADRPAAELVADVAGSATALELAWAALPADGWDREGITTAGSASMAELVFRRLREVEVHRVDLGLGAEPPDWPAAYVEEELRRHLPELPGRADGAALAAWLLHRGPPPELGPW